MFPQADPIPLPAPVWLLKGLSLLTAATHFTAVWFLLGGLALTLILSLRKQSSAALVISRRLPTVMTYVINLGVPPLLFAQTLYGRALYTSSVLMAAMWIAVIPLVMGTYWHLYRIPDRLVQGKSVIVTTLVPLLLAVGIAQIYAFNMTLMLRPEVWQAMYAHAPNGVNVAPHDPTTTPRWLFMLLGGALGGGLGVLLLSHQKHLSGDVQKTLRTIGGRTAALGAVLQVPVALWMLASQPAAVKDGISHAPLGLIGGAVWALGALLALGLGLVQSAKPGAKFGVSVVAALGGFLAATGWTLFRDAIRDVTLLTKGFDVWQRNVVANWSVIVIFLLLLVAGLGVLFWLIRVMGQATAPKEEEALV